MNDSSPISETGEYLVVYRYQYWDEDTEQMRASKWMATLQCIRDGLGTPIIASGMKVPRESVDGLGRLIVGPETAASLNSTRT
jgi:hypothetical protein